MKSSANLFAAIFIILTLSLSTIWSTTPDLVINQLTFILLAIFLGLITSRQSESFLESLTLPAYIITIGLLLLTFILGQATRGSVRWITLGPFNLQTSEIAKPLVILAFANFFSQPIHKPYFWLFQRTLLILPIIILILLQPDLGSAIIVSLIWIGLLLSSAISKKIVFTFLFIGIILLPIGIRFLQPYQKERLSTFINPYADPKGSGYNVIQSQIAIGSGHFIGKGVRQGTQSHLKFLPERHTDFAFASFAEEFGFLGSFILISSFSVVFFWLIDQIKNQKLFPSLIVNGVFWYIISQTIINLGMNLGIVPTTGITLPFFSYGGSSLLSLGLSIGLVFAVKPSLW